MPNIEGLCKLGAGAVDLTAGVLSKVAPKAAARLVEAEQAAARVVDETARGIDTSSPLVHEFVEFVRGFNKQFPQTNGAGLPHRVYAGSFATRALLSAPEFRPLSSSALPDIVLEEPVRMPADREAILRGFGRRMSDIDYIRGVLPSHRFSISVESLPELDVRRFLTTDTRAKPLFSVETPRMERVAHELSGNDRPWNTDIVAVNLSGETVYVTGPLTNYQAKLTNAVDNFYGYTKQKRIQLNTDIAVNAQIVDSLYGTERLLSEGRQSLIHSKGAKWRYIPFDEPLFDQDSQALYQRILNSDSDGHLLKQLAYGRERSIPNLRALHRLNDDQSKQLWIRFYNDHRMHIDRVAPNAERYRAGATGWPILRILGKISPDNASQELNQIADLVHGGINEFDLSRALNLFGPSSSSRQALLTRIIQRARQGSMEDTNLLINRSLMGESNWLEDISR